jgi:hypothetical protein
MPTDLVDTDFLTFVLSPVSGDADLYISTTGAPQLDQNKKCTNCIIEGSSPHGEVKQIQKNDPSWPVGSGATFYIGVYGYTAADYLLNTYTTKSK